MSFFKGTFNKAKESFEKGIKEAEEAANRAKREAEEAANRAAKEAKEAANKSLIELEKGADLAKQGLEEAGNFILNSSEREYWNREISTLKTRLSQLLDNLESGKNAYYETRLEYQERYCQYLVISRDTLALGLISPQELDKVTDTAGIVADATTSFYESADEVEEISRYALGIISAGISDIILASQEAEREAQHLREQIFALEDGVRKINSNVAKYQEVKRRVEQDSQEILKLYGSDTTIENFVEKQCNFIYSKGQEKAMQEYSL